MSADGIAQLAAVMGSCTAGGAYVPAMADETVIVRGTGTIFLGGPPLVKAATGEEVTAEELGGGDVHARISGVADHLAVLRRARAGAAARRLRPAAGRRARAVGASPSPVEPAEDPEELLAIVPPEPRRPYDMREVLARVLDGSDLHEFKPLYGETLVTAASAASGATPWPCWPTTASSSPRARARAPTSWSWPASAASRCCSCRTSPASWSARSTSTAASRATAPSSSPPSPAPRCRS